MLFAACGLLLFLFLGVCLFIVWRLCSLLGGVGCLGLGLGHGYFVVDFVRVLYFVV